MKHHSLHPPRSSLQVVQVLARLLERDPRSRKEIAKLAGVSPNLIAMWTSGKVSPSLESLQFVLDVLGYEMYFRTASKTKRKSDVLRDSHDLQQ